MKPRDLALLDKASFVLVRSATKRHDISITKSLVPGAQVLLMVWICLCGTDDIDMFMSSLERNIPLGDAFLSYQIITSYQPSVILS